MKSLQDKVSFPAPPDAPAPGEPPAPGKRPYAYGWAPRRASWRPRNGASPEKTRI